MKKGLIMEGGAMRGMFTAGVMDVLMHEGIVFDGAIGVSAGATFGCNYKSKQIGRTLRYNMRYCRDPRYCSVASWILTGDLYNGEFDYHTLPQRLDIWDQKTFEENPMEVPVVATDADTYAEHQAAECTIAHVAVQKTCRNHITQAYDDTQNKEANDNQTAFHALPPFPVSA